MKKVFFLSIVFISFISCTKNNAPKPEKLISEWELEEVLFEMAILQGAESQSRSSGGDVIDTYQYIKNRFGLDSLAVVQNNMYYSYDYKTYEKMNDRILQRLKKMKEESQVSDE